jgi:CRISPR-associated protein Cas2
MYVVRRYLVAYDIADDRRLTSVRKVCQGYGFGLQYSVYLCDLTEVELYDLKADLLDIIVTKRDRIAIIDLGPADDRGSDCMQFLGIRPSLAWNDATIL